MSQAVEMLESTQLNYAVYAFLLARGPQKPLYISLELNLPLEKILQGITSLEKVGLVKKHDEDSDYWMALLPTVIIDAMTQDINQDVGSIKDSMHVDRLKTDLKTAFENQSQMMETGFKEFENVIKAFSASIHQKLDQRLEQVSSKLQDEIEKFQAGTMDILSRWESELLVEPEKISKNLADRVNEIKDALEDKLDANSTIVRQMQQSIDEIISTSKQSSRTQLAELQDDLTSLLSDISTDLTSLIRQTLERISTQLADTLKTVIDAEIKRLEESERVLTDARVELDQKFHGIVQDLFRHHANALSTQLISSFKELVEKTQIQLKKITDQFLQAHEETITERVDGITLVFADFSKEIADIKGELFSETGTNEQLLESMSSLEEALSIQFTSLLDQVKVFFENVWSELRDVIQNQRTSTLEELGNFKNALTKQVKSVFLMNEEFWDGLSKEFQDSINELARLSDMLEQQLNLFMSNQLRIISKTKDEQKRMLSQVSKTHQDRIAKLIREYQKEVDDYQVRMTTRISESLSNLKEKHDHIIEQSTRGLNKMKQVVLDSLEAHQVAIQSRMKERLQLLESNLSSLQAQYQRFHADLESKINQVSGNVQNTIALRSATIHAEIQQLLKDQKESLLHEIETVARENNEELNAYYESLTDTLDSTYQQLQQLFTQLKMTIETRHSEQIRQIHQSQRDQVHRITQLFENIQERTTMLLNDLQARLSESASSISSSYNELHAKLSGQNASLLESQQNWIKQIPQEVLQEIHVQAGRVAEQITLQQEEILRSITTQKEQSNLLLDSLDSQALGTQDFFGSIKENLTSLESRVNNVLVKMEDQALSKMTSSLESLAALSERQIEVSRYLLDVEVNTRRNKALKTLNDTTELMKSRNSSQEETLLASIMDTVNGVEKATSEWEERMLQAIDHSKDNFVRSSELLQDRQKNQAQLVMTRLRQTWEEYREEISTKLDTILSQSDNRLAEIIRRLEESSLALSEKIQKLIQEQQQLMQTEVNSLEKDGFKEETSKIQEEFASILASHVQAFVTRMNEDIDRLHDLVQDIESAISSQLLAVENQFQETTQVSSHELGSRLNQLPDLLMENLQEITGNFFESLEQKNDELTSQVEQVNQDIIQAKEVFSRELAESMGEIKEILTEVNTSLENAKNELKQVLDANLSLIQRTTQVEQFKQEMKIDAILSKELQVQADRMTQIASNFRSNIMTLWQQLESLFLRLNRDVDETLQHLESQLAKVVKTSGTIDEKFLEMFHQRIQATGNHFSKNDVVQAIVDNIKALTPEKVLMFCTVPSIVTKEFLEAMVTEDSRINIIIPADVVDKLSLETVSCIHSIPRLSLYLNNQVFSQKIEKKGIILLYDDKLLHYWIADAEVFLEIADESVIKAFQVILKDLVWQQSRRAPLSKLQRTLQSSSTRKSRDHQ